MDELIASLLEKIDAIEKRVTALEVERSSNEAGTVYLDGMDPSFREYIEETLNIKGGGN